MILWQIYTNISLLFSMVSKKNEIENKIQNRNINVLNQHKSSLETELKSLSINTTDNEYTEYLDVKEKIGVQVDNKYKIETELAQIQNLKSKNIINYDFQNTISIQEIRNLFDSISNEYKSKCLNKLAEHKEKLDAKITTINNTIKDLNKNNIYKKINEQNQNQSKKLKYYN